MSGIRAWWREVREHPRLLDTVLAVGLVGLMLLTPVLGRPRHREPLTVTTLVLGAVVFGALCFRRRWPWPVLAIAVGATLAHLPVSRTGGLLVIGVAIAMYTVAATTDRRTAWTTGAIVGLLLAGGRVLIVPGDWLDPPTVGLLTLIGMATAVGDAMRSRRAYIAAIEERARRAEQTREEEAQRRVIDERLRIARELHDVLAHHIALINVQAGAAAHTLDTQPEQTRDSLTHIRHASAAALDELRATVGLLRRSDSSDSDSDDPAEPAPGLERLDELVATFTQSGLPVTLRREGEVRPVSATVDLTAYRVVQEALTNVRKHAGEATASVLVVYAAGALTVTISDNGAPAVGPPSAVGHGLVGMRERVAAVGGTLVAGPSQPRGYRVRATLPLPLPVALRPEDVS